MHFFDYFRIIKNTEHSTGALRPVQYALMTLGQ